MNVAPPSAAKAKGSAIDGRTIRRAGYKTSQIIRKRIKRCSAGPSPPQGFANRHRGLNRVGWRFTLTPAACT